MMLMRGCRAEPTFKFCVAVIKIMQHHTLDEHLLLTNSAVLSLSHSNGTNEDVIHFTL